MARHALTSLGCAFVACVLGTSVGADSERSEAPAERPSGMEGGSATVMSCLRPGDVGVVGLEEAGVRGGGNSNRSDVGSDGPAYRLTIDL